MEFCANRERLHRGETATLSTKRRERERSSDNGGGGLMTGEVRVCDVFWGLRVFQMEGICMVLL